jgi:hypothetical protein
MFGFGKYSTQMPKPPAISEKRMGEWQSKNKTKQIVMPAKPKISKDQLFPEAVQRAKDIVENSNIKEMVNGPQHYGGADNPYEVIKVCEAWGLDKDAYLFNVVKYVARAGKKDPQKELEDLKKAVFYLQRKVENLQK